MVSLVSVGYAQTIQNNDDPDWKSWNAVMADFSARVWNYSELRSALEKGLPPLKVTDDPAEIRRAVTARAHTIREARTDAKEGDLFTQAISAAFRTALAMEMDANTWKSIMDDNPGNFSIRINHTYPEGKPLSTVPPNVLAALPRLPDDIEYRFVGRHLILLDRRAYLILDWIPFAIESPSSVEFSSRRCENTRPLDKCSDTTAASISRTR
jgi:hypothetical protein